MINEYKSPTLFSVLRDPQPHIIVRSIASLAVGCLLGAAGIVGAILIGELAFGGSQAWRRNYGIIGLAGASLLWTLPLWLIWSSVRGRGQLIRPIFHTLAICCCASLLGALVRAPLLVAIIVLLAIGLILLSWASACLRWQRGGDEFGQPRRVDVFCPNCRYSLIGLSECRCPECGSAFTIEALIAAQGYGAAEPRGAPHGKRSFDPSAATDESKLAPA